MTARTKHRFQGNHLDARAWAVESGWGNGTETFTATNVAITGGELRITARREPDGTYTSGLTTTRGRTPIPARSYVEARMLTPTTAGCWPSFYTVGANEPDVAWPACGELDVLEVVSGTPHLARRNIHGITADGRHAERGWDLDAVNVGCGLGYEWHTYGLAFDAGRVRFDVDRAHAVTVTRGEVEAAGMVWVFDQPQHLMFALAVGKVAGDPAAGVWPQTMRVSRVTVWDVEDAPVVT